MVQIKPKDKNYYTGFDEFERSRFYLYETFDNKNRDCEGKAKINPIRKLIENKEKLVKDFIINDLYLFAWDEYKIKFWCLEDDIDLMNGHIINLEIS